MFERFVSRRIQTRDGIEIFTRVGGDGPPLLLLHGWPQTHVCWHKVADRLAERFTVVLTDLRGYGESDKPQGGSDHVEYSKRTMAVDQLDVMRALGFSKFRLVGHDRGGRVAHRLAVDHPDAVERLVLLDIAPTTAMYERINRTVAQIYYHWFFLTQPFDLPETLLGANPRYFIERSFAPAKGFIAPEALQEYVRCFELPGTIHGHCEDYRAGATIDQEHEAADKAAGRRIQAPLLAMYGDRGLVGKLFDMEAVWRELSDGEVKTLGMDCGHFIPEELPHETVTALLDWL